ncbi:SymE family type I addiction module toxin [uncultured Bacteroides sp.]|uniref:SymE family type I addiction module toxin n=1 Tax=Bacteroidales TaxID=171549 RepID=UPI003466BE45
MQSKQKKRIKTNIQRRTFTVTGETRRLAYSRLSFVPFIRLRGIWLKNAGFYIGQKIKVHISKNRLVITPEKHNKP